MTQIVKIKAEIERLYYNEAEKDESILASDAFKNALDKVDSFIDSLEQGPQGVDEAAEKYIAETHNELANQQGMCWEFDWDDVAMAIYESFKAGAEWQKEHDEKIIAELKKLADRMYEAASYLSDNPSSLHKAMENYHNYVCYKMKKQ